MPAYRPLKIYAFDPTLGRKLNNYARVNVRYEVLQPGPVGEYIAVIDYDGSNHCYYDPVDLNSTDVMVSGGLNPSESDPHFHQQMVYAVIMETIRRFEYALGRKMRWKRDTRPKSAPYHGKLRVFPHGIEEPNAFYDPVLRALVFGYFSCGSKAIGGNLPGQTVFTCLSHDVVAHETTHALVDGLREKFMLMTNPDVAAFHEAFADIVALFLHFAYEGALLELIERTGGYLYTADVGPKAQGGLLDSRIGGLRSLSNPLIDLAQQFGTALGNQRGLRNAIGSPPDPRVLEKASEEHERGAILVAAVFDAFFTIYLTRTQDLLRLAAASGVALGGHLHPDLTKRLATEAADTARQIGNICIRALDYCPPVDITFGEFLRALITADIDLLDDDPLGYRAAFIDAFRIRGIYPEDVFSASEDELRWLPATESKALPRCQGLSFNLFDQEGSDQTKRNLVILHNWATANLEQLGLSPEYPVSVYSWSPLQREAPGGGILFEWVMEIVQRRDVPLSPDDPKAGTFQFYGGATVIMDRAGTAKYIISKRVTNDRRLERQRHYQAERGFEHSAAAAFSNRDDKYSLRLTLDRAY